MNLVNLRERPQYLQILAEWHHAEWAHLNPGQTLADRIREMEGYLGNEPVPGTWLALEGDELLGSAALLEHDMDIHRDRSPWLASVYVAELRRGQGIGSRLVREAMRQARQGGFRELTLYTPDAEAFYARLGWEVLEQCRYHDTDVTVMRCELTA